MFTKKQKEYIALITQGVAHSSSLDDMFLWAVKQRDTALAKSVNGKAKKRKWNTYIYMDYDIWNAEWGSSDRIYLHGGLFCQKMRVKLSMHDGTEKEFNVFYDFHYA